MIMLMLMVGRMKMMVTMNDGDVMVIMTVDDVDASLIKNILDDLDDNHEPDHKESE